MDEGLDDSDVNKVLVVFNKVTATLGLLTEWWMSSIGWVPVW